MSLKDVHDQLLSQKPAGASHDPDCQFCTGEFAQHEGDTPVDKTYTDEEIQTLVAAGVAKATDELRTKLASYESSEQAAEIESRIEAAKAEAQVEVADLKTKLDEAVLEAETAKKTLEDTVAFLQAQADEVTAAETAKQIRTDRIAAVAEVIEFPEDHVKERADDWASLSDEQFDALLADYKALSDKKGANSSKKDLPTATAMQATRESGNGKTTGSAAAELVRMRQLGVDPRALR